MPPIGSEIESLLAASKQLANCLEIEYICTFYKSLLDAIGSGESVKSSLDKLDQLFAELQAKLQPLLVMRDTEQYLQREHIIGTLQELCRQMWEFARDEVEGSQFDLDEEERKLDEARQGDDRNALQLFQQLSKEIKRLAAARPSTQDRTRKHPAIMAAAGLLQYVEGDLTHHILQIYSTFSRVVGVSAKKLLEEMVIGFDISEKDTVAFVKTIKKMQTILEHLAEKPPLVQLLQAPLIGQQFRDFFGEFSVGVVSVTSAVDLEAIEREILAAHPPDALGEPEKMLEKLFQDVKPSAEELSRLAEFLQLSDPKQDLKKTLQELENIANGAYAGPDDSDADNANVKYILNECIKLITSTLSPNPEAPDNISLSKELKRPTSTRSTSPDMISKHPAIMAAAGLLQYIEGDLAQPVLQTYSTVFSIAGVFAKKVLEEMVVGFDVSEKDTVEFVGTIEKMQTFLEQLAQKPPLVQYLQGPLTHRQFCDFLGEFCLGVVNVTFAVDLEAIAKEISAAQTPEVLGEPEKMFKKQSHELKTSAEGVTRLAEFLRLSDPKQDLKKTLQELENIANGAYTLPDNVDDAEVKYVLNECIKLISSTLSPNPKAPENISKGTSEPGALPNDEAAALEAEEQTGENGASFGSPVSHSSVLYTREIEISASTQTGVFTATSREVFKSTNAVPAAYPPVQNALELVLYIEDSFELLESNREYIQSIGAISQQLSEKLLHAVEASKTKKYTHVIQTIREYVAKISEKKGILQCLQRRQIAQTLEAHRNKLWAEFVVFNIKSNADMEEAQREAESAAKEADEQRACEMLTKLFDDLTNTPGAVRELAQSLGLVTADDQSRKEIMKELQDIKRHNDQPHQSHTPEEVAVVSESIFLTKLFLPTKYRWFRETFNTGNPAVVKSALAESINDVIRDLSDGEALSETTVAELNHESNPLAQVNKLFLALDRRARDGILIRSFQRALLRVDEIKYMLRSNLVYGDDSPRMVTASRFK